MASVFVKVDPKERLPKKYGSYICLYNNSKNVQVTIFDRKSSHDFWRKAFDYWLEEVELPSAEDVNYKYPLNANELHKTSLNVGCRTGANWVLNKLKGQ